MISRPARSPWPTAWIATLAVSMLLTVPAHAQDPADLESLYAWPDGEKLIVAFTFAAGAVPGSPARFEREVMYQVHLDTDGDLATSETVVDVRFGRNGAGAWAVRVIGLPGSSGSVEGLVESVLGAGDGNFVFTGLRDDPEFVDGEGVASLETGTFSFDAGRDTAARRNATAVVLRMDRDIALGGGTVGAVWVESRRLP